MYELVNTSLPNGLIPGTHGFAAVAMTKGLPDTLRTRLETYCAYSHRVSTHDATYFTENPVNWFHVMLPQGDHVLGRVAPADFDYTGRTNRLARLLVFSKNEMPAIGGAFVLKKESARLSEAWSGEARWLESDKLTVGRLRLEFPPTNCDAPSWRAMFGNAEGLNLARGFARLLVKNLSTAGRTIYFKTSTAFDVDGTKLLALFSDLIDLLPSSNRRNITFSTYPVALPQGTICHLRGVYDRDRIFDAAAATQPWVDCEKGVVYNASLLPPEEVKQHRLEPRGTEAPVRTPQQPTTTYGARQQAAPAWMPPQKKDGTKSLFIGIIVIVAILITAAATCGIYLWRENERKIRESELQRQRAVEETRRIEEADKKARMVEAEQQRQKEAVTNAQAEAERKKAEEAKEKRAAADTKRKKDEERKREMKSVEENEEARTNAMRASATAKSNETPSFASAISVKNLDDIDGGIRKISETNKHFVTNSTLKVFWYNNYGMLTNCCAGLNTKKIGRLSDTSFKTDLPKQDDLTKNARCFFLLWYDTKDKTIYWDWSPLDKKDSTEWFINTNMVDLVDMCFGGTATEIYKAWEKHCGAPHFTIDWVTADGKHIDRDAAGGKIPVLSKVGKTLKFDELVKMYGEWEKKQQKTVANKGKDNLEIYQAQKTKIERAKRTYDSLCHRREGIQTALKNCKDNTKKRQELVGKIKEIGTQIDDLMKIEIGEAKSFFAISLKHEKGAHIDGWDDLLKKLDEEIKKLQAAQSPPNNTAEEKKKKQICEIIRHSKFSIIKVEGTKR